MSHGDLRRHERSLFPAKLRISWIHTDGNPRYAQARCLDRSEGGVRIESPEPVPVRSNVLLQSEQMKLGGGAAVVKHIRRVGAKYAVGLALCSARF